MADVVSQPDLLEVLGPDASVLRGIEIPVTGPAPVLPGEPGALSFSNAAGDELVAVLSRTASAVVLVGVGALQGPVPDTRAGVVEVTSPRLAYVKALQALFPSPRPAAGIHPSAVIDDAAVIGQGVHIGPGVSIGRATVGDRTVIMANAVILDAVTIGSDCIVGPNTTVGFTGFGYARDEDGSPVPFPHYAGVRIGDRVEIGANTAIDRGTLSDTVIEDDAKIDNLVHVAHNCHVRSGAFVIATSILCGGVDVGERAWIAPNSSIIEHVRIGDDATVGLAATVLKDVPPGAVVVGSPARPLPPRS